jgi:hypothetical protein
MDYVALLKTAFETQVPAERGIGCGRIYVAGFDKEHAKGIKAAAKELGKIYQGRSHYGDSNALYIGYDNCDGKALARGTFVVATLKAAGIGCYRNEHGD